METVNTLTTLDIIDKLDFLRDYLKFMLYIDGEIEECKEVKIHRADDVEILESGKIALLNQIEQEFEAVYAWVNQKREEEKIN